MSSTPLTETARPAPFTMNFKPRSNSSLTKRRVTPKREVMNQTMRKELLVQLQHLRLEVKEISRLYVANLQRDIVQLIDFLNEKQAGKGKRPRSLNPTLAQMKETLDKINLKPEKGRRKDLRRIERAVRSMTKMVSAERKAE